MGLAGMAGVVRALYNAHSSITITTAVATTAKQQQQLLQTKGAAITTATHLATSTSELNDHL